MSQSDKRRLQIFERQVGRAGILPDARAQFVQDVAFVYHVVLFHELGVLQWARLMSLIIVNFAFIPQTSSIEYYGMSRRMFLYLKVSKNKVLIAGGNSC